MKKTKEILIGMMLILVAVYLVMAKLAILPKLPVFTVLFTLFFGYTAIRGMMKKSIFEPVMSVAFLGCIYAKPLGITAITPWLLLGAALLIAIGLHVIFKGHISVEVHNDLERGGMHMTEDNAIDRTNESTTGTQRQTDDGSHIYFSNSLNGSSKYIRSEHFASAELENNLGSLNVYFDQAVITDNSASVHVENNLGETNLYFPANWRIAVQAESCLGNIVDHSTPVCDETAPILKLYVESNLGSVNIYTL